LVILISWLALVGLHSDNLNHDWSVTIRPKLRFLGLLVRLLPFINADDSAAARMPNAAVIGKRHVRAPGTARKEFVVSFFLRSGLGRRRLGRLLPWLAALGRACRGR
jgi:hypothetical protein